MYVFISALSLSMFPERFEDFTGTWSPGYIYICTVNIHIEHSSELVKQTNTPVLRTFQLIYGFQFYFGATSKLPSKGTCKNQWSMNRLFTVQHWTCSDLLGKIKHQVKKTQGPRRKPVVTRRKPVETRSEIQKHRVLEKHRVFLTHRKPVKTRRKPVKTRAKNMVFLGSWAYVSKRVF